VPENEEAARSDPEPGGVEVGEGETFSVSDRLALLASYVQPDGRLSVPGLSVTDRRGDERIVLAVNDREAKVEVKIAPDWSPRGTSSAALYATDGDDTDLYAEAPTVGVQLKVSGDDAVTVSAALTTERGVMGAGKPTLYFSPWCSIADR
jgi:hypothetical protein